MKKQLGYCISGYGFLRAFCLLCEKDSATQIGSSAGPDALDIMQKRLIKHMTEVHNINTECRGGDCSVSD